MLWNKILCRGSGGWCEREGMLRSAGSTLASEGTSKFVPISLSLTPLCIDSRFHIQTLVSDFKPQNANLSLPLPLLTDAPPPTTSHDDEYSTTPAPTKTLVGVVFFVHRSRRRWWSRRPLLTDTPLPPPPTPSDDDPAPTTTTGGVVFFAPCWWRR